MRRILPMEIARGASLLGLCLVLGLAGCDTVSDLFEDSDEVLLEGERLSVISLERQLEPDPDAALLTVRLPPPYVNEDWPQAGGYPHHAMHHLAAADVLAEAWRVRIGPRRRRRRAHAVDARGRRRAGSTPWIRRA